MKLQLIRHPAAPLIDRPDAALIFKQVMEEIAGGHFGYNEELRQAARQCTLTNLWFAGKFVFGYSGPFDLLNEDLHIDMANFRQQLLYPGCRGGMFIPRGHYKSAIVTEIGTGWEMLRNPDLRIRITNAIDELAQGFFLNIKAIFDSNDLMVWLFGKPSDLMGSFIPEKKMGERWNKSELVLPNRSRNFREANLEYGSVGGASEGHHYDLHVIDDMIGEAALNSMRGSNAVMESTRNWFWSSEKTLLVSMKTSRVIVVGTRYAVDDVYDEIIKKSHVQVGYPMEFYDPNPRGRWLIYYRMGIEDGKVIFPENFTLEAYEELAEDDWWTYITQYINNPQGAGLASFTDYKLQVCWLEEDLSGEVLICFEKGEGKVERLPLSSCDVVVCADPASTDRNQVSAKTSRSAVMVVATDCKGRTFLIWLRADFVPIHQVYNWLFEAFEKYENYVRATYLEANGPYKLLRPELEREQNERGKWIRLRDFPSLGEKTARIQSALDPVFAARRLYVLEPYKLKVEEEKRAFPQSRKKDILDALASAVLNSVRPATEEENELKKQAEEGFRNRQCTIAGY